MSILSRRSLCITFLGPQLSGKTTFARKVSQETKFPFIALDEIRLKLYEYLSSPKDWKDEKTKAAEDAKTKSAYNFLFSEIEKHLKSGNSLIVEMPYLGFRENQLKEFLNGDLSRLKIIWCQILTNEQKEIRRRINARLGNEYSATISESDYWFFKNKIRRPSLPHLVIDTTQPHGQLLEEILAYIRS